MSGALLILGAALAVAGSFTTLDESAEHARGNSKEVLYRTVAKAWSYSNSIPGQKTISVRQFHGLPLLVSSLLVAVVAAVLLLAGVSRRLPLTRVLGVSGATLLFGVTLTVATAALSDTQWDTDTRSTTLGPGFYLLTLASLAALAATVLSVLGTRRPAGPPPRAVPVPAPAAAALADRHQLPAVPADSASAPVATPVSRLNQGHATVQGSRVPSSSSIRAARGPPRPRQADVRRAGDSVGADRRTGVHS